jgi:hypothetical protein
MSDFKKTGDAVRAAINTTDSGVPELSYERLVLLAGQGYEPGDPAAIEAARERQREEVRAGRGDRIPAATSANLSPPEGRPLPDPYPAP